jgi:hypothetical protein
MSEIINGGGGGSGTVTSVTGTANQIDVATGTTTPVISLDPAITLPGTINKLTLTAPATGSTLTIADGKTLTASNTVTLSGTDGASLNISNAVTSASPGAGIARFAGSTQTVTSAELSGDVTTSGSNAATVVKVNGAAIPTTKAIVGSNSSNQIVDATGSAVTVTGSWSFSNNADKAGQASIISDSSGINTVETIVVKSAALTANRLVAGTVVRCTLWGTCTDSVANTSSFKVRMGTAGTTSDATVIALTTGASGTTGSSVPFQLTIEFTVRTVGSGTSATVDGRTMLISGANGIQGATTVQIGTPTLTGFDSTLANIISVAYSSAASTTTSTFKQAFIEIVNQ